MIDHSLVVELFIFGLTTGISTSLLLLRGDRRSRLSVAINGMLLNSWSLSRIMGWTNVTSVVAVLLLVFGVYCGYLLFQAWANGDKGRHSKVEHEQE